MHVRNINLSEIDSQNRYCYHMDLDLPDLRRSIQMQGIQMPLWLIRSDKPVVVDGFRRFHMAQLLEISEIPVFLFDKNDLERLFLSALSLNFSMSKLSIIEKLKVLQISRNILGSSVNTMVMDILDLHFIQAADEILSFVGEMPSWLQGYFHRINISLKSLKKLTEYPPANYDYWLKIANSLNFKGTELIRMLEMIREICMRDQISTSELWDLLSMDRRIAKDMTPQQISLVIKKELYRARFPYLSQINHEIREKVNQLSKNHKGNLNVYWDQSLEDSSLKLNFTLNETAAIDNISSFLKNSQNREIITDIFYQMVHLPSNKK